MTAALAFASLSLVAAAVAVLLARENARLRLRLLEEMHLSDWRLRLLERKPWRRDAAHETPPGPHAPAHDPSRQGRPGW